MKTLFQKDAFEEICSRVNNLRPETERRWGKMNIDQMMAHCSATLEQAVGDKIVPRVFIGRVIGRFLKSSFISETPLKRNGPTSPVFIIPGKLDFEKEKLRLLVMVGKFYNGGVDKCTENPHSFFGSMTKDEWARLMYKHLDHHLTQFGV